MPTDDPSTISSPPQNWASTHDIFSYFHKSGCAIHDGSIVMDGVLRAGSQRANGATSVRGHRDNPRRRRPPRCRRIGRLSQSFEEYGFQLVRKHQPAQSAYLAAAGWSGAAAEVPGRRPLPAGVERRNDQIAFLHTTTNPSAPRKPRPRRHNHNEYNILPATSLESAA